MAQIFVFGRVMNDLVPKESQSKQSYVCFDLMERTKNWTQFYQVWAWDADVTRLMQFKVKKGSMIWLAGSQRLVDVRMKDGKLEKKLKVSLNDFGFLPKQPAAANRQENDPDTFESDIIKIGMFFFRFRGPREGADGGFLPFFFRHSDEFRIHAF